MPDGSKEQWAYDGLGNTTAYENPLSQTIDYVFDNAGRQTAIDYPTGTDTTFTFDNANRRTGMVDSTGTTTWGFDNANRNTSLVSPQGSISYTLDNAGRRTAMTEPAGSWSYVYDNDNRMTSQENPASETTSWTYDTASRKRRCPIFRGRLSKVKACSLAGKRAHHLEDRLQEKEFSEWNIGKNRGRSGSSGNRDEFGSHREIP
jgi:YD repeat-containing protein